ncbi:MAG: hypothetical protein A2991_03825 [Candidatus Terrybacteria bacterium RIFCSPLOWO2_01_FULL_58_14]|uniref:Uncharacterized protein n=1 Tax=Candidatus Terrybacteria bacterium RIFCSPLOWO2_01_FULL_58_14 TaxID=1802369 RepID=A0A1G2Q1S7_9BACT|nr:MAG: hypothetical protein A2991_03825 [Candidatus Terrybacteria bacterium RIFCSPLOWO2_01_FULL_58_14]
MITTILTRPGSRSWWAVGFSALFVLASAATWWGAAFVDQSPRSFVAAAVGMVFAAAAFTLVNAVEGTPPLLRRGALASAFLLAVPLAFSSAILPALGAGIIAAVFAEFGALRIESFRKSFQHPRIIPVAQRGWTFYFSSVSIILTLVVFLSPLGAMVLNPVPEPFLRQAIRVLDPLLQPLLGFSVQGDVDHIIAEATGAPDRTAITAIRERYAVSLGMPLTGKEDLAALVSAGLRQQLARIQETQGAAYRFGFFVSLFLTVRFVMVPVAWAASLVTLGLLWAARSAGGMSEIEEPVIRTTLHWQ